MEIVSDRQVTFKKDICEKYTLKWKSKNWWAVFTISGEGMFNVQSDFGNYSYWWRSPGHRSFKEFLIDLEPTYTMGKLNDQRPRVFDVKSTVNSLKKEVIERRKEGEITQEFARSCFDDIDRIRRENSDTVDQYFSILHEISFLPKLYDFDYSMIPCRTEYDPMLQGFMKHIYPEFVRILKEELQDN